MTTLPDVDMPNALTRYAQQKLIDLSEDNCWQLPNGVRSGYTSINQFLWLHETVVKPTEIELINLHDAWIAEQTAVTTQTQSTLNAIKNTAQSAVGVELTALTANQRNALIAILLYQAGAINIADLKIRPLNDWVVKP